MALKKLPLKIRPSGINFFRQHFWTKSFRTNGWSKIFWKKMFGCCFWSRKMFLVESLIHGIFPLKNYSEFRLIDITFSRLCLVNHFSTIMPIRRHIFFGKVLPGKKYTEKMFRKTNIFRPWWASHDFNQNSGFFKSHKENMPRLRGPKSDLLFLLYLKKISHSCEKNQYFVFSDFYHFF